MSVTSKQRSTPFDVEVPARLYAAVLARVALARRRAARIRLAALGTVMTMSGLALASSLSYIAHEFYTSGLYDYFSLLFSDSTLALSHWQEFSLSLLEAVPSIALMLLIGCLALFFWSARRVLGSVSAAELSYGF